MTTSTSTAEPLLATGPSSSGTRRSRAIGPAGTAARILLGGYLAGSVIEAEISGGFTPLLWALGLLAFPGVLLAAQWARAQRGGGRLHATGPVAHLVTIAGFMALTLLPEYNRAIDVAGDAAVIFVGTSMLLAVRNVGGRVTPEVLNDVAFIGQLAENFLPGGPLFEVAVIHHTQCGSGALADDTFRHRYAQRIGAEESTLREHAVLDPAATAAHDVERLQSAPAISPRATVSGHVYDVLTGLVKTVIPADR